MMLHSLIRTSLQQLEDMQQLIDALSADVSGGDYQNVVQFNCHFAQLHDQARVTDSQISEKLEGSEQDDETLQLLDRRRNLQNNMLTSLKKVLSKANSLKSLLRSEMDSISRGRCALKGYGSSSNVRLRSKIVNTHT